MTEYILLCYILCANMLLLLSLFLKHKHEIQANSLPLVNRHGTLCNNNEGTSKGCALNRSP